VSLITPVIQRWIDEGRRDPDALWARAADDLPWFRKWDRVTLGKSIAGVFIEWAKNDGSQ
jgi:hypothetical protein